MKFPAFVHRAVFLGLSISGIIKKTMKPKYSLVKPKQFNYVVVGLTALTLAIIGYFIISSRAAGTIVSIEPENAGQKNTLVTVGNDSTASAGKFIQFNAVPPPPGDTGGLFGINVMNYQYMSDADQKHYLDDLKQLGVQWIRFDFQWSGVQYGDGSTSRNNANTYNWTGLDQSVRNAASRGLKILGDLTYSPRWAISAQGQQIPIGQKGDWEKYPPVDVNDFANYAQKAAERYGPNSSVPDLRATVRAWEIWNEANGVFWTPNPDAAYYSRLLKAAYPAIKRADPGSTVVSTGLAPYGKYPETAANFINPTLFLERMYQNLAAGSFDALGWHPYDSSCQPPNSNQNSDVGCGPNNNAPWSAWYQMFGTTPNARSLMAANGDSNKKIWMTEFGLPTGGPGALGQDFFGETRQALYVTDAYNKIRTYQWAGPLFWFAHNDIGNSSSPTDFHHGLVHSDFSPKPSYSAYCSSVQAATGTRPPCRGL